MTTTIDEAKVATEMIAFIGPHEAALDNVFEAFESAKGAAIEIGRARELFPKTFEAASVALRLGAPELVAQVSNFTAKVEKVIALIDEALSLPPMSPTFEAWLRDEREYLSGALSRFRGEVV